MRLTFICFLILAVVGTSAAWYLSSCKVKQVEKTNFSLKSRPHENVVSVSGLTTQDQSRDLRRQLDQAMVALKKTGRDCDFAVTKLSEQQHDFIRLQEALADTKQKLDASIVKGDQEYVLYTKWKEFALDQKEYATGLYADDVSLRRAAKQEPYKPMEAATPETVESLNVSASR